MQPGGPAEPDPLTPEEMDDAVAVYRRLKHDREAGYKMWQLTWDKNGISVGSINRRIDITSRSATLNQAI